MFIKDELPPKFIALTSFNKLKTLLCEFIEFPVIVTFPISFATRNAPFTPIFP